MNINYEKITAEILKMAGVQIGVSNPWDIKVHTEKAPSRKVNDAFDHLFVMEDWHNFGNDYDKTLMVWYDNFVKNWDKIKSHASESFFRMWKYYLLACAGAFRSRQNLLWQIVLSKKGIPGGYRSVR